MIFDELNGKWIDNNLAIVYDDCRRRIETPSGSRPLFPNFGTLEWTMLTSTEIDIDRLRDSVFNSLSQSNLYSVIDVEVEFNRNDGFLDVIATINIDGIDINVVSGFDTGFQFNAFR